MKRHKSYSYFTAFTEMVGYSRQAATMLDDILNYYNKEDIEVYVKEIHDIEHSCDLVRHKALNYLMRDFITPIEREDIIALVEIIDDVTDAIEDVIMAIYMFDVDEIRPEALAFSKLIFQCTERLRDMFADFANFKKSKTIRDDVIAISGLEEEGDRLYMQAIRTLHVNRVEGRDLLIWTRIFDRLEKCCDRCDQVANTAESVVLKNS